MQIGGDLDALQSALSESGEIKDRVVGAGKCSALVKLLPGNAELFVSHDTWDEYQSMLRIYKLYDLRFSTAGNSGLYIYKWKNHFYEMKGDVGMSLHEKERNKKMPTPRHKVTHNPIPTSLFCFNMLFVCLFVMNALGKANSTTS